MGWTAERAYCAKIGGILYRNVRCPVAVGSKCLLGLSRNDETRRLGVTLELGDQNGQPVATVSNNAITIHQPTAFEHIDRPSRQVIRERATGHIWCDIVTQPLNADFELQLSCRLFAGTGFPIF